MQHNANIKKVTCAWCKTKKKERIGNNTNRKLKKEAYILNTSMRACMKRDMNEKRKKSAHLNQQFTLKWIARKESFAIFQSRIQTQTGAAIASQPPDTAAVSNNRNVKQTLLTWKNAGTQRVHRSNEAQKHPCIMHPLWRVCAALNRQ